MSNREFDPRDLHPEQAPAAAADSQRRASADSLRSQAAACRRLSAAARTRSGTTSLAALADHFDEQARQIDPTSLRQ